MVTRIRYEEEQFKSADDCNAGIVDRLDAGWSVSRLEKRPHGSYRVLFRRDLVATTVAVLKRFEQPASIEDASNEETRADSRFGESDGIRPARQFWFPRQLRVKRGAT